MSVIYLVVLLVSPVSGIEEREYPIADWDSCVEAVHTSKLKGFVAQRKSGTYQEVEENRGVILFCRTDVITYEDQDRRDRGEGLHIR